MKKKLIYAMTILSSFTVMTGCENFVNQVEEQDPTRPVDASISQMMVGTQTSYMAMHEGDMARLTGIFANYFTGEDRQYISYENYIVTSGDFDAAWGNIYTNVISQAKIIEEKSTLQGNQMSRGLAKFMQAHGFALAASLWGDVPFDQVNQLEEFPNPAYEPQADVYSKTIALIDDAIVDLTSGVGTLDGDIYYGGNAAAWVAAANTLKARMHLHLGEHQNAIDAAANGITDASMNLLSDHSGGAGPNLDWNTYFQFMYWHRDGYMGASNAHLQTVLANRGETARQSYYYYGSIPNIYGNWWGLPDGKFFAEQGYEVLSSIENNLIIAEAEAELGNMANALAALNDVRAELDAQFGGYPAYVTTDFADIDELLMEIHTEKYISLYGHIEGFVDLVRTNNAIGVTVKKGSSLPKRLLYAQDEINSNANAPKDATSIFEATPIFK